MASKKFSNSQYEVLLKDYSCDVSFKSSVLFYGNALIVSIVPIWIYWRILHIDVKDSLILFTITSLISSYLISFAYKKVKYVLKFEFTKLRKDAVRKEINYALLHDKKMSKKEKDDRISWRQNEVSDYEATTYSIFYNNALFLFLFLITSMFIFKRILLPFNYFFSILISSALVAVFSGSSKVIKKI